MEITNSMIIFALSGVIVSMAIYIVAMHRDRLKQNKEDKKLSDENAKEMTKAVTMGAIAIENNTKAMQQNTEVLNTVKYRLK